MHAEETLNSRQTVVDAVAKNPKFVTTYLRSAPRNPIYLEFFLNKPVKAVGEFANVTGVAITKKRLKEMSKIDPNSL